MITEDASNDDISGDIFKIINVVRRRKRLVAGTVAFGLGVVLVYLLVATPLYTATAELRIDLNSKNPISNAFIPAIGSDKVGIESEVRLLESASIANRVVAKFKLERDPEFNAQSEGLSPLILIKKLVGWTASTADVDDPEQEEHNLLIRNFLDRVNVRRQGLTYVISISFTSRDPHKAAKIANQIADSYLVDQLETRYEAMKRASDWLNERIGKLRASLQQSEKAVEVYRAKHNLIGDSGETPFDAQLKKLNEELILARVQMKEKEAQYEQAQAVIASRRKLTTIDAVAGSETIKKLQAEQAKVAGKLAELVTRFTERHPKVLNVKGEQRDLNRQIEIEARRIVANLENEYQIAKRRVSYIEQSLQKLQDKTKGARAASIRLKELEREAAANRAIYESFLSKFKETSEQETLKTNGARIITRATPPLAPSKPNKKLTLFLALIGFSALGVGLAVLMERLDNSFKSWEQLEEVLKLSTLASVPKLLPEDVEDKTGRKLPIVRFAQAKPLSAYAESLRNVKVGLQLFNVDKPPQVILVTSAVPNEGKTTVVSNLAQHLAASGVRTLLIDCDLRNPSLAKLLGYEGGAGLIELLSGKASCAQVLVRDKAGFDFIQTTCLPQNSEEILGPASMKWLFDELRPHYDMILLDAMPIAPVVDTKVLIKSVDAIVLVVEWDSTPREVVKNALKKLNAPHDKLAGAILNKMDMRRMASYGSYGGYGYYHQEYGNYYSGQQEG